jgi:putative PIN family toxin of toxin-antitoxin system
MRTVVDTNVSVSAFLNPRGLPCQLITALQQGRFTLVTSEPMLSELADVLTRPRLVNRHRRTGEQVAVFVEALRQSAEIVPLLGEVHVCRDPDDDAVLETALLGDAAYVVSGDQDTQAREVVEYLAASGIRVLTVREFLALLETADAPESTEPGPETTS